jgi:hypothetical protein
MPMPRLDDALDALGDAKWFTTLDANSGFWQVKMAEEDIPKTAVTSHRRLFEFTRMPFGLVAAPATFKRAIDIVLSTVRFECALTYLDDIIIYSSSFEQHLEHLATVLKLLSDSGVSLKLTKCRFAQLEVDYLGFRVSRNGLEVNPTKTEAIMQSKRPGSKKDIRSFLGMPGVYRRFIKHYSEKASPLTSMLRKEEPERFQLNSAQDEAFEFLRKAVTSSPCLALPRAEGLFIIETDVSENQLGAVLLQEQEMELKGKKIVSEKPVGFYSRKLNSAESRYSPTEREALAIVWACKLLRHHVDRRKFLIRTDHSALTWLYSLTSSHGNKAKIVRRITLSCFDFEVEHRPGTSHRAPDYLSRVETRGAETRDLNLEVPCLIAEFDSDKLPPPPSTPRG